MPPVSDDHLDVLLGTWADQQRLTAAEAERIRTAIVQQPAGLPATWWRDFSAQISATVTRTAQLAASPHLPRVATT